MCFSLLNFKIRTIFHRILHIYFVSLSRLILHSRVSQSFIFFLFLYTLFHYGIILQRSHLRLREQLLQKYKAQRHAVSFQRYLIYQGSVPHSITSEIADL